MKRYFVIFAIVAALFADTFTASSQSRRGAMTSSTTVITRTRIHKEKDPIKIKWQHSVDLTYTQFIGATYTGGWRFGNFLYLGFGTGIQVNPRVMPWDENGIYTVYDFRDKDQDIEGYNTLEIDGTYLAGRVQVPVYVHMKFRFMKTKVSPYLSVSGGFNVYRSLTYQKNEGEYDYNYGYYTPTIVGKGGVHGGEYAEAMIGVDFRLKNGSDISFGLGPIWQGSANGSRSIYFSEYSGVSYSDAEPLGGFKLGYSF